MARTKKNIEPLTQDVIDYDFFGKELSPPRKIKTTNTLKETAKLLRLLNRMSYQNYKPIKYTKTTNKKSFNRKQPCTVKLIYGTDKKLHQNFLKNYMPQNNKAEIKEKPNLFNESYTSLSDELLNSYEQNMTDLHFKFIISPENQTVDMTNLVRAFIGQIEKATGFKFSWVAVKHTNTEHIHSHILINGIDKEDGRDIHFDKIFIKETARLIAQNLCTGLVGLRTNAQIKSAKERLPFAHRYTQLDNQIEKAIQPIAERVINDTTYESQIICKNEEMQKRLSTLVEIGLAYRFSSKQPPIYLLEKNWIEKLRSIGRYNTFLTARQELRYTSCCNLEQYTKDTGIIEGIITQRYIMDDEGIWANSIVIENKKLGKSWFVPLKFRPEESLLGAVVNCNLTEDQRGLLRPKIKILCPAIKRR